MASSEHKPHSVATRLRDYAERHGDYSPGHIVWEAAAALGSLEEQLETLNAENASLNAENRDLLEKWSARGGRIDELQEQLDSLRFCPYCATGFIPNPPDVHRDSCPGCARANRLEDELAGTLEQLEAAREKLGWYERTRWVPRLKEERDRADALQEQLDALLNAARKALPEDRRDDEGMIYRILGSTVELERVVERIDGSNPAKERP